MERIGIDTGGTFTDIVIYDENRLVIKKVLSDRTSPKKSLSEGLKRLMDTDFRLTYGTTIAVNAFLEKKGGKTALLATSGFEHVLHIQRQKRINLFSLFPEKADSLIPLELCFGIDERILYDGKVEKEIDLNQLKKISQILKKRNVISVTIAFLHSYKNDINERKAEKFFKEEGFFVSASFRILPEQREYERAVISALNAYIMPPFHDHIEDIKGLIRKPFYIMQSVGGFLSPESAQEIPVKTMLSGPVGGVIAAHYYQEGNRLITLDMGGTSTDISLIDREIAVTQDSELENLPIRIPTVFIQTIGAGGGSIAWFDKVGVLKLGPMSAGSDPGPACYGKSDICTLTDAYVFLGYIMPDAFLGGEMRIYPERSIKAIGQIAKRLGKTPEETAEGIIDLSIVLMEKALRNISLQKGYDPSEFELMPFGGAGGLAAVELAEKIGIKRVIIPPYQGVLSAVGMLIAKSARESSISVLKTLSKIDPLELEAHYDDLEEGISAEIKKDFYKKTRIRFHRSLDMRYKGQTYYINIPYIKNFSRLYRAFSRIHKRIYSHCFENKEIEVVNIRVKGFSAEKTLELPHEGTILNEEACPAVRQIFYKKRIIEAAFHIKESIREDDVITGPAILSSKHSTVFIPPYYRGKKSVKGNIIIEKIPV